jgi:hypothetical protein
MSVVTARFGGRCKTARFGFDVAAAFDTIADHAFTG